MLTYIEFVIIFIIAVIFLKPKDVIYLLSFLKEIIAKFKHLLYVGKQEINKIIDETTINDLKEKSKELLNNPTINETKKAVNSTKNDLESQVKDLYNSVNLNCNLDNILKNNDPNNLIKKENDSLKEKSKDK